MLPADVEGGRNEEERWGDGALEEALKGSERHELGETMREANTENKDSPAEHAYEQSLVEAEALHQVVSGSFADKIHDVKDGA